MALWALVKQLLDNISELQNLSYVDLDQYIELNEEKSIPDIFNDKGEHEFRKLEFKYLKECLDIFDIISTGGGIIENSDSLALLKMQKTCYLARL